MRVLLVSHQYPPAHSAGTEVYTANLARGLRERGHDVEVFTTEKDISREHLSLRTRVHDGVTVHELCNNLHYQHFRQSWDEPEIDRRFGEVLDRVAPDLVHFHHLLYLSVGCAERAAARGVPVVFTLHDYWLQCPRFGQRVRADASICRTIDWRTCSECLTDFRFANSPTEQRLATWIAGLKTFTGLNLAPLARRVGDRLRVKESNSIDPRVSAHLRGEVETRDGELRARLAKSVDLFLSPSAFLREQFLEWGIPPERIEHLRSGVDLDSFHPDERKVRGEVLAVGFVGSLVRVKGAHVLLEAWKSLAPALRSRAQLTVHGPSGHDLEYQRELEELALASGAELKGPLRREEVSAILRELDLLVVPSVWFENQPLVILEALACGLPLLVSDLGGMAELVDEDRGWRFSTGDVSALGSRLGELIGDPTPLDALYTTPADLPGLADQVTAIEAVYHGLGDEDGSR
jgi:glycosyltransferase involved in cell wall biosynthesis